MEEYRVYWIDYNILVSQFKMHDMHLGVNISNALQQLESVKAAVDQSSDPKLKVIFYFILLYLLT